MNKIALLFIAVFMSNPAFSQTRHFEISYNFGILQDSYTTGNYNTIPLLNPEIRIGYELINNCIVSLNYGFWDNNVESRCDLDGIIIDASIINHTDNSFGILINKKNTHTFRLSPFIGCSVHILKSYTIESMSGHYYEKKHMDVSILDCASDTK